MQFLCWNVTNGDKDKGFDKNKLRTLTIVDTGHGFHLELSSWLALSGTCVLKGRDALDVDVDMRSLTFDVDG